MYVDNIRFPSWFTPQEAASPLLEDNCKSILVVQDFENSPPPAGQRKVKLKYRSGRANIKSWRDSVHTDKGDAAARQQPRIGVETGVKSAHKDVF